MKIDTSKLEGYANLTPEEKIAFLEGYEFPEAKAESVPNDEITRLKNALSKSNSEAADYRKKWQSTLSEQERLEAERQQRETDMQTQLNALLREKQTSEKLPRHRLFARTCKEFRNGYGGRKQRTGFR